MRLRDVEARSELGLVEPRRRAHRRRLLVEHERIGRASSRCRDVAEAIGDAREQQAIADRLQRESRAKITLLGVVEIVAHDLRDAEPAPREADAAPPGDAVELDRAAEIRFGLRGIAARELAVAAGVAVMPASPPLPAALEECRRLAHDVGYPVMLKASWGGGGRGMRGFYLKTQRRSNQPRTPRPTHRCARLPARAPDSVERSCPALAST